MPRPTWKGAISFGMVSIPIQLFTAADSSKEISFHLLHKECMSRIKYLRWCPIHEREVRQDEIVRGYEHARDQYVILTEDELEQLPLPSARTIELSAFVREEAIDPVFFERTYYLLPESAGAKPYELLMRALKWKGLIAIATVALRQRERLCALRPRDGTLMLHTLFYADEIREETRVTPPGVAVSEQELSMAFSLIDLLSRDFEPEQYHDRYRAALEEVIQAKLQGQEVVEAPGPAPAKVTDLMAALRASVEAAKRRNEPSATREAPRRRKAG